MKIVSGNSNLPLAEKIAKKLNLSLTPREIFIFPDGERRVQIQERVVDEDCVVVQSTATPTDTNYMELFFLVDALKRSGARRVTLVMPYVGYQRQDHVFREGEAVSMQVIIKTLEAVGVDKLICFDLHAYRIQELFSIPVKHFSALPLFAEEIKKREWDSLDSVLVSPDMGGIRRIEIISRLLGEMPYATILKNRDLATGFVEAAAVNGEVGRRVLMVDDMISSGKTIVKAAELLRKHGAQEIEVFATHAVLSDEAPELLQNSIVDRVYVTDTVDVPEEKQFEKLHILTVADKVVEELLENASA